VNSARKRKLPDERSIEFPQTNWRGGRIQNPCQLGQLAHHIASIPGRTSKLAQLEEFDASQSAFDPPAAADLNEIHAAFDQSVRSAEECLGSMTDEAAVGNRRRTFRGKRSSPNRRAGVLRSVMLNHWYHHRGQLSVYLRLLGVPVPAIYGRSADENLFPAGKNRDARSAGIRYNVGPRKRNTREEHHG